MEVRLPQEEAPNPHIVNFEALPPSFPTHRHSVEFWEGLGRLVATFGFLEEILGKAIFAFTATREYSEDEVEAEFEAWLPTLQRALNEPLNPLVTAYSQAVRNHHAPPLDEASLDELVRQLRQVATLRNAICHGSWRQAPDSEGRSVPFYVDRRLGIFGDPIDLQYLQSLQRSVAELACDVMNTVTLLGWQFPGSKGLGEPIFARRDTNS
jgi:hypothetical protein